MKYKNADILPKELIREIQKYVQGESIYIPVAGEQKRKWGECSGERCRLNQRNEDIRRRYQEGITKKELAGQYYLSEDAIRKILRGTPHRTLPL